METYGTFKQGGTEAQLHHDQQNCKTNAGQRDK